MNTGGKAYALKFISGKYQGGEFPLTPGKEVLIGRSSELELVLIEEMVSRKHARLLQGEDGLVITDLGSTNGTFVNGEKIREMKLKEGDRFLIGTSIFKVITVEAGGAPLDDKEIKDRLEEVAAAKPKSGGAMSGRIDEVSIPDLLQLFHASKKSGILVLIDGAREAKIYLRKGMIVYAVIDDDHDIGPLKSIYRLIGWEVGTFELMAADDQSFPVELEESTASILMEGSRQLDELRRLEATLPRKGERLELAAPLGPPLRELEAEALDLLQLVINLGELNLVLDQSPSGDLDTATMVDELMSKGYVRVGRR